MSAAEKADTYLTAKTETKNLQVPKIALARKHLCQSNGRVWGVG